MNDAKAFLSFRIPGVIRNEIRKTYGGVKQEMKDCREGVSGSKEPKYLDKYYTVEHTRNSSKPVARPEFYCLQQLAEYLTLGSDVLMNYDMVRFYKENFSL